MSWVKLDDRFFANPKVIDLPKDAKLLYLAGLTHCAAQLTDGALSHGAVRAAAALVDVKVSHAAALVKAGLWDEAEGGYQVHDYLEYNPTAEKVKHERDMTAKRQAGWRNRHKERDKEETNPGSNADSNAVTDEEITPQVTQAPRARVLPSPSPSPDPDCDPVRMQIHDTFAGFGETAPSVPPKKRPERPPKPDADAPAKALLVAFREARYPGREPFMATDWRASSASLRAMVKDGKTAEQMATATEAAIRRWGKERVTLASVSRHWDALLEPDAPPRPALNGNGNGHASAAGERQAERDRAADNHVVTVPAWYRDRDKALRRPV